jgi:hypothetical protein
MFAHAKGAATTTEAPKAPTKSAIDQTSSYDFSKLIAMAGPTNSTDFNGPDRRRDLGSMLDATWQLAEQQTTASAENFVPQPLSREEARLWLQAYNAGPYALLKYKGNVPYKETQNYAPRVFKYYMENLKDTPYEPFIQESAKKYGLDPQFIRAIMKTESDFRNTCKSGAGACGLMQVMPAVWSEIKGKYGLEWDYASGVFEPQKNIEVACAYLAWLRYDFLPRHFAEYEQDPAAPVALVRDKDRGVPDRPTPRIETAVASAVAPATAPAQAAASQAAAPATTAAQPAPAQVAAASQTIQHAPSVASPAKQVASAAESHPKVTQLPPRSKESKAPETLPSKAASASPDKILVEVAEAKGKQTTSRTRAGKTVVNVRPGSSTVAAAKKPAVASSQPDAKIASAAAQSIKPNPRSLKKPAVAQADDREEEKRS